MKTIFIACVFLFVIASPAKAQTTYEFSFMVKDAAVSIPAKAFLVDYGDGNGIARIKFKTLRSSDSSLIDYKVSQEITDTMSGCVNIERLYFNLERKQLISGSDSGITLPKYICFTKDKESDLYEPFGFSYAIDNCGATVTAFSAIRYLETKDLSKEFVLGYFNIYESFYKSLFLTKTKDLTVSERSVKMYLLVVANTFDDSIGSACAKDMRRTVKFFTDIKDFLGIQFEYDTIAGKNYNLGNVEKGIDRLKRAGPNDIVVFYYSGHGFRTRADSRYPPYIDLRPNYKENPNNLNSKSLADIYDKINKMPARLKLVFSDCCNDTISSYSVKGKAPSRTKGFALSGSTQNAADLFLNKSKISVLATGANVGQLSICNDDFGGFFSYNLWQSIEKQIGFLNVNASWDKIKVETSTNTKKLSNRVECPKAGNPKSRCYQTPYIVVEKSGTAF